MLLDQHQQQQQYEEVEMTVGNENYGFIYLFYKTTSRFRHFSYREESGRYSVREGGDKGVVNYGGFKRIEK